MEQSNSNRVKDISSAASAFSQVTGVLGGFSATILVLILTDLQIESVIIQDILTASFILSASIYIVSAGIFANATSYTGKSGIGIFDAAVKLFHIGNLCLMVGLIIFIFQFTGTISRIVGVVILVFTFFVAAINLLAVRRV